MNIKFKRSAFIWNFIFCNSLVSTVTFDNLMLSCLTKILFIKKSYWANSFEWYVYAVYIFKDLLIFWLESKT